MNMMHKKTFQLTSSAFEEIEAFPNHIQLNASEWARMSAAWKVGKQESEARAILRERYLGLNSTFTPEEIQAMRNEDEASAAVIRVQVEEVNRMNFEELKACAKKLGVEFRPQTGRQKLLNLVVAEIEGREPPEGDE